MYCRPSSNYKQKARLHLHSRWPTMVRWSCIWWVLPWTSSRLWLRSLIQKGVTSSLMPLQISCAIPTTTHIFSPLFFSTCLLRQARWDSPDFQHPPTGHDHLLIVSTSVVQEIIQEQITRVLLERLIVNRPHPWGLLITFIELIKVINLMILFFLLSIWLVTHVFPLKIVSEFLSFLC